MRSVVAIWMLMIAGTAHAQPEDPLRSPGCVHAMEAVQAEEARVLGQGDHQAAPAPQTPQVRHGAAELRVAEH